jgi:hypothetical protein
VKRRDFLRKALIGTAGLAALPLVPSNLPTVSAQEQVNFNFTALSKGATIGSVAHIWLMSGEGRILPNGVEGGGAYNHYDDSTPAPKTILEYGSWEATRLISWREIGTWGVQHAGVLDMEVNLNRESPSPAVTEANLKVICNAGAAKLFNPNPNPPPANLPEGYILTIPGAEFGPFVPHVPPLGVTFFLGGTRVEDKALENLGNELQTTRAFYLPAAALIPSVIAGGLAVALAKAKKRSK